MELKHLKSFKESDLLEELNKEKIKPNNFQFFALYGKYLFYLAEIERKKMLIIFRFDQNNSPKLYDYKKYGFLCFPFVWQENNSIFYA